jgi:hypothetical protein
MLYPNADKIGGNGATALAKALQVNPCLTLSLKLLKSKI